MIGIGVSLIILCYHYVRLWEKTIRNENERTEKWLIVDFFSFFFFNNINNTQSIWSIFVSTIYYNMADKF